MVFFLGFVIGVAFPFSEVPSPTSIRSTFGRIVLVASTTARDFGSISVPERAKEKEDHINTVYAISQLRSKSSVNKS